MDFNQTLLNSTYLQNLPNLITRDLSSNLLNLGIYLAGMVLYVIIIWHFYRNLAKRELFKEKVEEEKKGLSLIIEKISDFFAFVLRYMIIFPFITFIWFLILGAFLLFLSKSNDVSQIFLMSISVIATARIISYYNEELAKDVAKLVPFGLLGVFIVDPTYFSLENTLAKYYSIPNYLHVIFQYLIVLVVLEVLLRLLYKLKQVFIGSD